MRMTTHPGLAIWQENSVNHLYDNRLGKGLSAGSSLGCSKSSDCDPTETDLVRLNAIWPQLSTSIQLAIITIPVG